jgi:cytochrome P450
MTDRTLVDAIDLGGTDLTKAATYMAGVPHDAFALLRAVAPVAWHREDDGPGFWALTGHRDSITVSRDSDTFSSWAGGMMIADSDPASLEQMRMMMIIMDPPEHTKLRLLINKGFTPRHVQRLHDRISEMAREIVDTVAPIGECDFVTQVSGELPSMVIADLMGIPLDHGRMLYELTEQMHTNIDRPENTNDAQAQMFAYAQELAARKRNEPGDDIASALLASEVDGRQLTDLEFNLFFMLLINAGGDTTRNLVANGMLTLLDNRDQLELLRDNPALLPTAVEEMLRYVPPVLMFRRTATRDTELSGVPIAAGEKVVMFYPAANRDPAVFADPDRFDVTREPNPHVAFGGGGAHFCLGANLARVEIRAMFEQVLWRLPDLELAGPVEPLHSNFIWGPHRMPVRFTPA